MSGVKLGERLEEDCLEFMADCLESHHRGGRGRRYGTRSGSGDLLYDLVRYQASQVNHLARLGLAHLDVGRRVLESWYGGANSCTPCGAADHVVTGAPGEKVTRKFFVENRCHPDDTMFNVRTECFRDLARDKEFNVEVEARGLEAPLKKGMQYEVTLTFTLDKVNFLASHDYETVVHVCVQGRSTETLVLVAQVR